MKTWVDELKSNGPSDIILAIVGNKIDRYDDEEVSYADVKEYASQVGAILKLVSAKEGKNITVIFLVMLGFVYYCSRNGNRCESKQRYQPHRLENKER